MRKEWSVARPVLYAILVAPTLPPTVVRRSTDYYRVGWREHTRDPWDVRRYVSGPNLSLDCPRPCLPWGATHGLRESGVAFMRVLRVGDVLGLLLEPTLAFGMCMDVERKALLLHSVVDGVG